MLCGFTPMIPVIATASVLKDVEFTHTQDVGFGNEVFVSGPNPSLGGDDPLRAIKMTWSPGHVWRVKIALPAGVAISHRFLQRSTSAANWGNAASVVALTSYRSLNTPAHAPAPWTGKTIFLHSAWDSAQIFWRSRTRGTEWTLQPMRLVGPGRTAGERLFRVDGLAAPGEDLEFVFTNGSQWLNAPAPPTGVASGGAPATPAPYQGLQPPFNFRTSLDVLFVQDQQIFNYRPPASVSPPTVITRAIGSTVPTIPGRTITIHLPRGYAENTWKKYPVLYFHDGQNVFFPGGPFGTWDADRIANYETSQGRMRECILVAIPNGNALGSDRLREYLPDGDSITLYGGQTVTHVGAASRYGQFLVDNVLPTLDFNFRTLGGAADTFVAGSSMGGLASDYLGHTRSDRFGGVGIFSPAYWAAPNFTASRGSNPPAIRRFLSMGTAESSTGESSSNVYWNGALAAYNAFAGTGQPILRDLLFAGVSGGQHNEPAWSRLLPIFYAHLLSPVREANRLAVETYPPQLILTSFDPATGQVRLQHQTHFGFRQVLQSSRNLRDWTDADLPSPTEAWDESNLLRSTPDRFWRVVTRLP